MQLRAGAQGGDVHIWIEYFNVRVGDDGASRYNAFAFGFNANLFRHVAVELCSQSLQVQDDFSNVFLHPWNG